MYDFKKLSAIESRYMKTKDNKILGELYTECLVATKILLNSYLNKIGLKLTATKKEEVVHDSVTRLLELYLKNQEYGNVPFCARLHKEIQFQLHNEKLVLREKTQLGCELIEGFSTIDIYDDEVEYINELKDQLGFEDAKQIVFILYNNRYFKHAILEIDKIIDRTYIYQNVNKLKTIFDTLKQKR